MNKVSCRDFRNAFVAVMKSESDAFRTAIGFETKSYNYFMRTNIYPKIAKHLGLLSWNKEYHGLNGMFYEERATDNFGNFRAYAKWISVAIEHENNGVKAHETVSKGCGASEHTTVFVAPCYGHYGSKALYRRASGSGKAFPRRAKASSLPPGAEQ